LLGREIQLLLQIQGKGSKSAVVGKAFEYFGDVCDPEGPFEASADLVEAFGKGQSLLLKSVLLIVGS
jgi:hypothetical protein